MDVGNGLGMARLAFPVGQMKGRWDAEKLRHPTHPPAAGSSL
jgi:hypothetical protein